MTKLRALAKRMLSVFCRNQRDADLAAELESHLQFHIEDNLRAGMPPEEARRQALIKLGGLDQTKESIRAQATLPWLDSLVQDTRFALRMLRKNPGFTAVAILTLALGVGANTAIFCLVNAVLLKPLPYRNADRLLIVWETNPGLSPHNVVSPPNFLDWQSQNSVFESMSYFADSSVNLTGGALPEQVDVQTVEYNFFDTLGIQPMLGHAFTAANDEPGNDNVVVLSYALWKGRFGSDPNVIGKHILINGFSSSIIGVAPENFDLYIAGGSLTGEHPQLWAPFVLPPALKNRSTSGRFLTVVARLKSGVEIAQAQAQMNTIAARLARSYPSKDRGWGVALVPIRREISGNVRPALLLLAGAVGLVLLIACANLSSLLLARATRRRKELAIRAALGASRPRIARQLLVENIALAALGGTCGLALAVFAARAVLQTTPAGLFDLRAIPIGVSVFLFTLGASLVAAILFGFIPSFVLAHSEISASLGSSSRGNSVGVAGRSAHNVFIVTEIALALVLLVGSGLLVQSFLRLVAVNPGFNAGHLLTFKVQLPAQRYTTDEARTVFFRDLLDKLDAVPGVRSASAENLPPFSGFPLWGVATSVLLPGQSAQLTIAQRAPTAVRVVGANFFRTMEIPVIQGRAFSPAELASEKHVVVINQTFANKYFPGANPIGQKITINMKDDRDAPSEIVGVVADAHESDLAAQAYPLIYWPYPELTYSSMSILVRTAGNPLAVVSAAREAVLKIDKDEPISAVAAMDQLVSDSLARSRLAALLLTSFAGISLLLASIGIYGLIAYSVAQRTHEIGIRIALGASRGNVLGLAMGQGLKLAAIGSVIGLAGALGLTRFLGGLLYGVASNDPLTFIVVPFTLVAVALLACYIPARRATRIDPVAAMRCE